jgi:drug/metabolite transporter (DMT)-like permease
MSHARVQAFGIGCAMIAALFFSALDTTVRHLGNAVPMLILLVSRYAMQAVAMAAYLALSRRHGLRSASPGFQALRGVLLLLISVFSFLAVRYMPVAEVTAIVMLTPVMVTLAAAIVLGERVSPLRWTLVLCAFAGVLVIVRPGSGLFGWAAIFPLGVALCNASFQLLTSRLAARVDPYTTHFWTAATGLCVLVPLQLFSPVDFLQTLQALPLSTLLPVVLVGAFGTVGHLLLILAFQRAPASLVSPLMYVQIAFAVLLGWLVVGDWPDGWAWVGMAIVAACGATTAALNFRRAPAPPHALPVAAGTVAD